MSQELKQYLHSKGIATSRTTSYNPEGNGQCERYNGIVWKAIQLSLFTKGDHISHWETAVPDALHSIRSLLSTATNCTPHERMFMYNRRSSNGSSVPSWLTKSRTVLLKRRVRQKLTLDYPRYKDVRYKIILKKKVYCRTTVTACLGPSQSLIKL